MAGFPFVAGEIQRFNIKRECTGVEVDYIFGIVHQPLIFQLNAAFGKTGIAAGDVAVEFFTGIIYIVDLFSGKVRSQYCIGIHNSGNKQRQYS